MENAVDFTSLAGPLDNPYVVEWKAGGGRVMGFFCSHAPEELLWAAGLLPLRVRGTGSEDTTRADQYLGAVNCSFVRHALNRLLDQDRDLFDAVLITNSCDHIRRLGDICKMSGSGPSTHYLDLPHVNTETARARLVDQLRKLRREIESSFEAAISDEKLREAIALHNCTRELLRRASRLRAEDPPRATGSEVLAMAVAAASMPKDRFNALAEQRLGELDSGGAPGGAKRPRLMIIGGMLDDPGYLAVFEELGAHIVADQLCCGAKTYECRTDEEMDPIDAIAFRMLDALPCPRMIADYEKRFRNLADAVTRHRIDGIICERLKFCDLWAGEAKMLRQSVQETLRIPFLALERDYLTPGGMGQLRTRAQAFIENIG